jgi:hypothetical protein
VFFILNVSVVDDGIFNDRLPMSVRENSVIAKSKVMSRRHRSYALIGSQLTGRLTGKVEGRKVFIEI